MLVPGRDHHARDRAVGDLGPRDVPPADSHHERRRRHLSQIGERAAVAEHDAGIGAPAQGDARGRENRRLDAGAVACVPAPTGRQRRRLQPDLEPLAVGADDEILCVAAAIVSHEPRGVVQTMNRLEIEDMTGKGLPPHADDAINLYRGGLTVPEVSRQTGIPAQTIYQWVRKAGATRPRGSANAAAGRARRAILQADVVARFSAGRSVKAIASEMGVSRPLVQQTLLDAGIAPRNRSEGMHARMAETDSARRKELASAANVARRGTKVSDAEGRLKAIRKCETGSKIGEAEADLVRALQARGLDAKPQHPVGPYNIDIMCGDVAVEVHSQTDWPHSSAVSRKRIEYLLNLGLNVLYVLCVVQRGGAQARSRSVEPPTPAGTDEIIAFVQQSERDPAFRREYRVIRRSGERVAAARDNLDDLPLKPVARRCKHGA